MLPRVVVDLPVDRVVLRAALPGVRVAGALADQRQPQHRYLNGGIFANMGHPLLNKSQ